MIAGFDFSTHWIDAVMLDEDTNRAHWHRRALASKRGKTTAIDRVRHVRHAMPSRGLWLDSGVTLIAIEIPYGEMKGASPLYMVLGALLAVLPAELPLRTLRADDWRRECGLPMRAERKEHKAASMEFARSHWAGAPELLNDNGADAFCIAWAGRSLESKAAAA